VQRALCLITKLISLEIFNTELKKEISHEVFSVFNVDILLS